MKETIRDWSGRTIGYIDHESNGDKKVTDWSGRTLGYYRKSSDTTVDWSGRILYRGDMASALLIVVR